MVFQIKLFRAFYRIVSEKMRGGLLKLGGFGAHLMSWFAARFSVVKVGSLALFGLLR